MPISLDPKTGNNPTIPIKTFKEFTAKLVKEYTVDKLKADVKIEDAKASEIFKILTTLNDKTQKLPDDGNRLGFEIRWTTYFKADEESGKKLFEYIQKNSSEIKDLERKGLEAAKGIQALAGETAAIAKSANDEINAIFAAGIKLNAAVDAAEKVTAPPTGAPPPSGGGSPPITRTALTQALAAAPGVPKLLGQAVGSNWNVGTVKATNADTLFNAIKKASADPAKKAQIEPVLKSLGLNIDALPDPKLIKENIKRQISLSKKLYKLGFITENEYLSVLVSSKKLLKEQGAPPPGGGSPPAIDPATKAARDEFNTYIANIGSTASPPTAFTNYTKAINDIQDITAKKSKQTITENDKRLIKTFIKYRLLKEVENKENKKEYLNELGILLGAALLAIGAWIGKKFAQYFSYGPAKYSTPNKDGVAINQYPSSELGAVLGGNPYSDGDGNLFSADGKKIDPEAEKKAFEAYKATIEEGITKYQITVTNLSAKFDACKFDATNGPAIKAAIDAMPKALSRGPQLVTSLQKYVGGL